MEDGPSSSALPWLWVIEYLACFPQVKACLLHAVLEVAPELPDDFGKDMREVVALRCLEELCGPRIVSVDKGSREESGSKLDICMSCKQVLASVFRDDSVTDLRVAEKELLKWDMNSFLEHKRACMPLTSLQRLKMKINSNARSQDKDNGGLASRNTEGQPSGEYNEPSLEPNGKSRGEREEGVTGSITPTSVEQRECDNVRTSRRSKRSRTDPAMENLEESLGDLQHDLADNLPHSMTNPKGISGNANKESYHLRGRGSKEVCITPIRQRTRQKKAEWTADEDMTLKEGVEEYTDENGTYWTSILASKGDHLKGRTTMDLKNRWNNTLRKAGK